MSSQEGLCLTYAQHVAGDVIGAATDVVPEPLLPGRLAPQVQVVTFGFSLETLGYGA
jgi:hypothetical protein